MYPKFASDQWCLQYSLWIAGQLTAWVSRPGFLQQNYWWRHVQVQTILSVSLEAWSPHSGLVDLKLTNVASFLQPGCFMNFLILDASEACFLWKILWISSSVCMEEGNILEETCCKDNPRNIVPPRYGHIARFLKHCRPLPHQYMSKCRLWMVDDWNISWDNTRNVHATWSLSRLWTLVIGRCSFVLCSIFLVMR